jgi:hypothetical protein
MNNKIQTQYKYIIKNIYTTPRHPGIIYAEIINGETNELMVSATLAYCYEWIVNKIAYEEFELNRSK